MTTMDDPLENNLEHSKLSLFVILLCNGIPLDHRIVEEAGKIE